MARGVRGVQLVRGIALYRRVTVVGRRGIEPQSVERVGQEDLAGLVGR